MVLFLEIEECGDGISPFAELIAGKAGEARQAVGVLVWIGIAQGAVDHAEDGGCGTYTESQREDSYESKAEILAKIADGVVEVTTEIFQMSLQTRIVQRMHKCDDA